MNITIKKAGNADAKSIAKVHVDSWRSTYKNIVPDSFLDNLTYEKSEQRQLEYLNESNDKSALVALIDDQVVGFAMFGKNRDDKYDYQGEIYGIYLLEEYQGKGIGKLLFNESVKWLIDKGYKDMILWVLKDNIAAIGFYEKVGGTVVADQVLEIGKPMEALGYGYQI